MTTLDERRRCAAGHLESPHEEHRTDPLAQRRYDVQRGPDAGRALSAPRPTRRMPRLGSSAADRFRPVPVWVIAGCALLLLWAGIYLGTLQRRVPGRRVQRGSQLQAGRPDGPVDPLVASNKRGQKLFTANCAQCHQATASGRRGSSRRWSAREWVIGDAPKRLPHILLHGIQGAIHVKGAVYNNRCPLGTRCSTTSRSPQS